jgi:alginate O-acetyltransferase complex protein AlgI
MCWNPAYIVLIILSTLIDYFAAIKMGEKKDKKDRKKYLILSLVTNLGLLFVFKYFGFFSFSLNSLFQSLELGASVPHLNILLPVGISFYTFQTLSYSIDVYRGHKEPERHLGIFALYVSFFPQLVAGPIERSTTLLPQFHKTKKFDSHRVIEGLKVMAWGFFKKVVIADRLAIIVNTVYSTPTEHTGFPLIVASVFFAFQIYCDFSGYSDIAIGGAQVLGFNLMRNFDRPYFSKSIPDFWKRWHISLSTWFRDYLYISLGGNRVKISRCYLNLFLTFLISGLWHGANWTFVIWGALHGFYMIFGKLTVTLRSKTAAILKLEKATTLHSCIQIITTFGLVTFSWIFFRANTLKESIYIAHNTVSFLLKMPLHIIQFNKDSFINIYWNSIRNLGLNPFDLLLSFLLIGFLLLTHALHDSKQTKYFFLTKSYSFQYGFFFILIFAILFFGFFDKSPEFIYFQF